MHLRQTCYHRSSLGFGLSLPEPTGLSSLYWPFESAFPLVEVGTTLRIGLNKNDYETLDRFNPHQGQPNPKICADNRRRIQQLRRPGPALPETRTNPPREGC